MSISTILPNYNANYDKSFSSQQLIAHKDGVHFFSVPRGSEANESVKELLLLPYSIFIETKAPDDPDKKEISEKDINQIGILRKLSKTPPIIALSITTESCYTIDLAHSLIEMLGNRLNIINDKKLLIVTCLHEAIVNAILHGNLNIESDFRTPQGLYIYQTEIEHRLKIDSYKLRRVHIRIWKKNNNIEIAVSDEGNGFDLPTKDIDETIPNGRGLRIISSLSDKMWLQDRHTLFMTFTL
jgi:anti-sigma regulatory factor (Ser/Thr protein kinase)